MILGPSLDMPLVVSWPGPICVSQIELCVLVSSCDWC